MKALSLLLPFVAACSLVGTTSLGGTSPSGSSSSSPSSPSSSPSSPASSSPTASNAGGGAKSYWSHEDLQTLRGLTVEQATAKAKSLGFTGWIRTQVSSEFIQGCAQNTVCEVDDSHGMGGGVSADDGMMLYTNKPLAIPSGPPPD